MSISCTVFDIARCWSQIADLNLPHFYLALPLGVTPSEFRRYFGIWNSIFWAIVRRCLRHLTFSHFGTMPACDRRTDGWTHDDSIYRTSIASRGKNWLTLLKDKDGSLPSRLFLSPVLPSMPSLPYLPFSSPLPRSRCCRVTDGTRYPGSLKLNVA